MPHAKFREPLEMMSDLEKGVKFGCVFIRNI